MSNVIIVCQHCENQLQIEEQFLGYRIHCIYCQFGFVASIKCNNCQVYTPYKTSNCPNCQCSITNFFAQEEDIHKSNNSITNQGILQNYQEQNNFQTIEVQSIQEPTVISNTFELKMEPTIISNTSGLTSDTTSRSNTLPSDNNTTNMYSIKNNWGPLLLLQLGIAYYSYSSLDTVYAIQASVLFTVLLFVVFVGISLVLYVIQMIILLFFALLFCALIIKIHEQEGAVAALTGAIGLIIISALIIAAIYLGPAILVGIGCFYITENVIFSLICAIIVLVFVVVLIKYGPTVMLMIALGQICYKAVLPFVLGKSLSDATQEFIKGVELIIQQVNWKGFLSIASAVNQVINVSNSVSALLKPSFLLVLWCIVLGVAIVDSKDTKNKMDTLAEDNSSKNNKILRIVK